MLEAVCHHLSLQYDLCIRLHMQSVNGEVDESLGLACNISARIGNIVVYIQVHVIRSPAYDILLGHPFNVLMRSIVRNFLNEAQTITISNLNTGLVEVFTLPLVFRTDPRRMARIPRNSVESADPRTPIFWCIVASPFRADPCGSTQNDAESGPFSDGSVELTRTVPC